jgi:hypothetical protein
MTMKRSGRPRVLVEQFEELEVLARAEPETARLEFINGRIEVQPPRDGGHHEIMAWLRERLSRHQPELRLHRGRGLKVETCGAGRARPDGVLAPREHFTGAAEWAEPGGVLMVAELARDGYPDAYAAAGIPVHLRIDRVAASVTVSAGADTGAGRYRYSATRLFGAVVKLPEPVGVTLETRELKGFGN